MADENLLVIDGLRDVLTLKSGEPAYPVDGVSFTVPRSKTVGLVGESGCGKSMTARTVMRILDTGISVAEGSITFDGEDLLALPEQQMRDIRGNRIAMIFQEPMTALNPSISVGKQVREAILLHEKVSRAEAKERVIQMFREVGIPEAERRYKSYPHQLSGGLRQRICIAMGMICNPDLLIADEPTTALDVTVRSADPRAHEAPAARERHVDPHHHPQPRRRGRHLRRGERHVRRPDRGARHEGRDLQPPAPPLHHRPHGRHPARERRHGARPAHHPRHGARARELPRGLPLLHPLPVRRRALPHAGARARRRRRRPPCPLLQAPEVR